MAMAAGEPLPHSVQELAGDAHGALFAVAVQRDEAVADVADEGGGRAGVHGGQVHGQRVGQAFAGADQVASWFACRFGHGQREHHDRLADQAEPVQGVAGRRASFQRGGEQVCA